MISRRVKLVWKALVKKLGDIVATGDSVQRLAVSFCAGLYISFSPFPGLHTIMMIAGTYLFKFHFPTLFFATSFNNPWTMIPFFSLDYAFGYWIVHHVFGLEPALTISYTKLFGSTSICVWSFLIGGNLLGIIAALVGYPIMIRIFKKMLHKPS